ncbi:hypothetical protein CLV33_106212 [Jejuia pallidilutea]|uniref:DUF5723 domain-containing protein n=1 Tax=Jejuia pallidilutea TaxID=504487 RepID=A0A362X1Z8_9FLAO|nr:DUF5723 family protein [Jejuia pallidilutea]PQV47892.1 hypothetical protein CLV33_106212 [Jejuia pallidilutea]
MKNSNYIFYLCCVISLNLLNSQSYVGLNTDNYAGVHSLILNPSGVVDSRFKTDINLISISAFGGSDYFGINFNDIIKAEDGFDFDSDVEKTPTNANNFFVNTDILGPSFMFNLSPKSSMGILSRVRAVFNLHNVSGELYENLSDNFDTNENFNFNSTDVTGTVHAWAEISLVYGRILIDSKKQFLKGGISLKYLQGAGGVFVNSPNFTGNYDATNETLATTGALTYGTSQDFNNDDIEFKNLTSGFGADIGFTYEYRPHKLRDSLTSRAHNKYKLKIGAAITDIGSIDYKESTLTTYNLNATADTSTFNEEGDIEQFLDDNYNATETTINQKIQLPTALRVLIDYQIRHKIYVSLQGNLSLKNKNTVGTNSIINNLVVSPRLETRLFSLYAPISFREYGDVAWGAGFRFSGLTIGSGSILSNLITDSSQTTDVYLGLKIPIYQKRKR